MYNTPSFPAFIEGLPQPTFPNTQAPYSPSALPPPTDTYPTGFQGDLFANIVQEVQSQTMAPLPLCIQAALGVGAFLLQGLIEVEAPDGRITPASLVIIGVADPAEGKSSILKHFMAPIDDYLDTFKEKNKAREAKYELDKEVWEKVRKSLVRDLANARLEEAFNENKG